MSVGDSDSGLSICSGVAPGSIRLEVRVPDLDLKKMICVPNTESVAHIKRALTDSLSTRLRDAPNYGLFIPGTAGKAGKFLQEERPIQEYGLSQDNSVIELRYKKRLFKSLTVNISKLKKLHSRANLKSFMELVKSNDTGKVLKMLNKGLDPNFQMRDSGETPLTKACGLNDPSDMIKTLVEGGAHIDYRHNDGYTPIHIAAIQGNAEAVKTLLDLGQSPNTVDLNDLTPLYHSVINDASAVCTERLLFDFSVIGIEDEHGLHEIHQACRFGRVQHIEYLLQYGADINCQTSRNGNTPLHICAYLDQESCARLLLFRGADRSLANRSGQTPYQQAVFSNNLALAQLIQEYRQEDMVPMRVNPQYNKKRKSSIIQVQSVRRSKSASRLCDPNGLPSNQQQNQSCGTEYSTREDSGCHSNFSGRSRENSCRLPKSSNTSCATFSLGKSAGMPLSQSVRRASGNYRNSMTLSRSITTLNHPNGDPEEGFLGGAWWDREWDRDTDVFSNNDESLADESVISGATNSTTSGVAGPMQRRSARSKTKASNGKTRSQSAKRRSSSKGHCMPPPSEAKETDVRYLPRMVVLQRTSQGFGFVIRGLKASSTVEFSPTKKHPGLQYFEDIEPNSVASRAGINKGDFILQINSHDVATASHEDTVSLIKASGDILALKIITVPPHSQSTNGVGGKKINEVVAKPKYNDMTVRSLSTRERRKSGPNPNHFNLAYDSSVDTDCSSSTFSRSHTNSFTVSSRPVSTNIKYYQQHSTTKSPPSTTSTKHRPSLNTMMTMSNNSTTSTTTTKTLPNSPTSPPSPPPAATNFPDPLPPPESAMLANSTTSAVKIRNPTSNSQIQQRPPSIVSVDSIYPLPPPPTTNSSSTNDTPLSPKFSTISEEEPNKSHLPPSWANQITSPNNVPAPPPPTNCIPPPPPPTNSAGPPPPPPPPPKGGPPKPPPAGPPKLPPSASGAHKPLNIAAAIEKPPILKPVSQSQRVKPTNPVLNEFDSHLRMAIAKRRQKMDCDQMSMTSVESSATGPLRKSNTVRSVKPDNNNSITNNNNKKSCSTNNSNKLYLI